MKCKVCNAKTKNSFNINLKQVSICEDCANMIMMQQINWLVETQQSK